MESTPLPTWDAIYELPLRKNEYGYQVYNQKDNFVFEFNYSAKPSTTSTKLLLEVLNGEKTLIESNNFTNKDGEILYKGIPMITIRGWGNLTGVGSYNLQDEIAGNIQDTFAEWITNKLNNKI